MRRSAGMPRWDMRSRVEMASERRPASARRSRRCLKVSNWGCLESVILAGREMAGTAIAGSQ